ncbi:MAG: hypothetical protein K6C36_05075 [Clostridia bacterium]|nr:hypothetical protein [Clostridia bacterium]
MKKILAFILCAALLLPAAALSASAEQEARLFNVYADHMLFQRDSDAVFAGEAPDGSVVTARLYDKNGSLAASGSAVAADGRFSVSFPAPAGGYDEYTVAVSCGSEVFATLSDVVFGELWLAFGQSNMEYQLAYTPEGKDMIAAEETGPRDVRVLYMPAPAVDGVYQTSYLPRTDAVMCSWFCADDPQVYYMSAPAYFFAVKLQQKLDMPVGVLSVPLGGSAIAPWLSREAIEGSETVKNHLIETGGYYGEERWSDPDRAMHLDMTNLYNTNIAPVTNFRPQGAIWYQGCTDLILKHSAEYYRDCFDLMQDSYTADFAYSGGRMPFIFTQLACYDYGFGPLSVTSFNEVFTDLAKADPASRGEVTIYDISLEYNELGYIHPMTKKPVGERMFALAEGLVYGEGSPTSAPYCSQAQAADDGIYLTFENVGDGLMFAGGAPRGFSVCGADGVAVEADAEIVSADTVRVFSEFVETPVAAAYAAGSWSQRANLRSSFGGEAFMPAAPVGIRDEAIGHHYVDNAWMDCEDLTFFRSGGRAEYIDAWTVRGCSVAAETGDKAEGDGSLRITSDSPMFELSPNVSRKDGLEYKVFDNVDPDWSDYGELRLSVKNCGGSVVRLNELRLYTGAVTYYTPVCAETGLTGLTVPADGEWHTFTFDLGQLRLMGVGGRFGSGDKLGDVRRIRFMFEGSGAELLLDGIRVLPANDGHGGGASLDFIGYIKALLAALRDMLYAFFGIGA